MSTFQERAAEAATSRPAPTPVEVSDDDLVEAMRDVVDPELGIDVVSLGLLYGLRREEGGVVLEMTLTSAACPLTDVIESQVESVMDPLVGSWRIEWVWTPPWSIERITDDGRDQLRALGFSVV